MNDKPVKCDRCEGVGSYWRAPDGFNPFRAGGFATARAAYRVSCWRCCGTGHEPLRAYRPDGGDNPPMTDTQAAIYHGDVDGDGGLA